MIGRWSSRRRLTLVAAGALLAAGAALLAASVLTPPTVSSAVLGEQWQCSSFALLTVCTQSEAITPVAHDPGRSPGGGQPPEDATAAVCVAPGRQGSSEQQSIKFETLR